MRPRVFPAEDGSDDDGTATAPQASMRPRVFPAEDSVPDDSHSPISSRFNEAAGIPRGRRR